MISHEWWETRARRAIDFLSEDLERSPDGLWWDYSRAEGSRGSNVWVSAFVAAQLGSITSLPIAAKARAIARTVAERLLARARPSGGWGYDDTLLEDCDSTAWVLLACARAKLTIPRPLLVAALRFIVHHQTAEGGFVTYGSHGVPLFGRTPGREGWFSPQCCVSAAALMALATYVTPDVPELAAAIHYLQSARGKEALWSSYWWHGPTYATRFAVEGLLLCDATNAEEMAHIAERLRSTAMAGGVWPGPDGDTPNAFATALAISTLLSAPTEGDPFDDGWQRGLEWLIERQRPDGGFVADAALRIPGAHEGELQTVFGRGLFTTAAAVRALDAVHCLAVHPLEIGG
jgi:squalene-hopene/tetraprenyl-beta-curcumene cyclase